MNDRSEKNRHHVVNVIVLGAGLLAALGTFLLRIRTTAPFGIAMWIWVLAITFAIVSLRELFVELGVHGSGFMQWTKRASLLLCVLIGVYIMATPLLVVTFAGIKQGLGDWLISIALGGPIIAGSLMALWQGRDL